MIFLETIPIIPLKISYKWKDLILQTLKYASAYVKEHKEEFIAKVRANASIQKIDIYLKFVGKLDVPMSELTPEHWKEEERKRKKRAWNRTCMRSKYEKKKAAKAKKESEKSA